MKPPSIICDQAAETARLAGDVVGLVLTGSLARGEATFVEPRRCALRLPMVDHARLRAAFPWPTVTVLLGVDVDHVTNYYRQGLLQLIEDVC